MAFLFKRFHTCTEVWNKYGTWKGAWGLILPYLPYLPYLHIPRIHGHTYACACARMHIYIFSMEGMEVWKSSMNKWSPTSTPVPYLSTGMEHYGFIGGLNG